MATTTRKTAKKSTAPRRPVRRKTVAVATAPDVVTPEVSLSEDAPAATSSWILAARAMESKKAEDLMVLDLRPVTSFADFMLICSGGNSRQIQTIADEVEKTLKQEGERPNSVEGYTNAEWILMDYGDFVVNIFSKTAREYYDLERLWRDAPQVPIPAETENVG